MQKTTVLGDKPLKVDHRWTMALGLLISAMAYGMYVPGWIANSQWLELASTVVLMAPFMVFMQKAVVTMIAQDSWRQTFKGMGWASLAGLFFALPTLWVPTISNCFPWLN